MEKVLFSTTESIPGYRIIKRIHFVHSAADVAFSHLSGGGDAESAHTAALKKLEAQCESHGANACVGLQTHLHIDPKMKIIIASLSGTAVLAEPD